MGGSISDVLKGSQMNSGEIFASSMGGKNSPATGPPPGGHYSSSQKFTAQPHMDSTMKKEALLCDLCRNNATCIIHDQTKDLQCVCAPGFGGAYCEIAMDVCLAQSPCVNFGRCVSDPKLASGFRCECPLGFNGDLCERSRVFYTFTEPIICY